MDRTRTEALSDGVFAVAATLLVFSVQVPDVKKGELGSALLNAWPAYAAYAISFTTILVIWVNHHGMLENLKSFDRPLLYLNGLLLMFIAAIPFPTFVLAKYFVLGHDRPAAAVAYGLVMSLMSFSFGAINVYAGRRKLFRVRFDQLYFSIGQLFYPTGTVIAFFSPELALAIYAAMVVYYGGYPIVREAQRSRESARG